MENITSAAELKNAIAQLEFEQSIQGNILKDQVFITYESLKPVSLIKSTLNDITSSPYLMDNMLGSVMGLLSGFVSKKLAVGTSHNIFRKVVGTVLQFGVTNVVAQHPEVLKTLGRYVIHQIVPKINFNNKKP